MMRILTLALVVGSVMVSGTAFAKGGHGGGGGVRNKPSPAVCQLVIVHGKVSLQSLKDASVGCP